MATYVVFADLTDDTIYSGNATYATARSGSGLTLYGASSTAQTAGQEKSGGTYYIYEAFESFTIPTLDSAVSSVVLSVFIHSDVSTQDFTLEARAYDWGASVATGDYVAGASLSGCALRASISTSGISTGAYTDLTSDSSFVSNLSSPVRLVLCSDRVAAGTTPTTSEYVNYRSSDQSGTTNDPKLTIITSPAATGVVLTDDFTGADTTNLSAHALSDGSLWTQTSSSGGTSMRLQIASNTAQARSSSGYANARYRCGAPFIDGFAEATFTRAGYYSTTYGGYGELALRDAGGGNSYQVILDNGDNVAGGQVQLYKAVSGVGTLLGSYDRGSAWPSTVNVRFEVYGTALRVYVDGVLRISVTDSTHTAAGYAVLGLQSSDGTSTSVGTTADNFAAYSAVYGSGGEIAFVSDSGTAAPAITPVSASDTGAVAEGTASIVTGSGVTASDAVTVADSVGVLSQIASSGTSASGLSGWTHRKAIRVDGNAGAQTNYPAPVDVAWLTGIRTDFADVRFTSADGTTPLTYWKDAALLNTGVSARFYVVIPSLPASGGSVLIYMHYGNSGASYAGQALGANGAFADLDGGSGTFSITRDVDAGQLHVGSSGAWDDEFVGVSSGIVRNLDGTAYRDGSGYFWLTYNGSLASKPRDDDRMGLFKTTDFQTFTKVTTSDALLTWGTGSWVTNGSVWDGRVCQQGRIYYDAAGTVVSAGSFFMFYDGDAGYTGTPIEAYRQGVATATSLTGPWTKYAGNPTFAHSYLNDNVHDDSVAYAGDFLYDADEPDSNKRWKQWYTGNCSTRWGVMYATAPSHLGPWTRHQSTYVWQPQPSAGGYDGLIGHVWKLRGIYYMIYEVLSGSAAPLGFYLGISADGINWTDKGRIYAKGSGGAWDAGAINDCDTFYDVVAGKWRIAYSGRNGTPTEIRSTSWTATPAFLSSEPTVTFLSGGESVSVSDSAAVTVGVGAITKTASDGFNVTDTSGGLAVTYWLSSGETVVVADGASSPNTTTVGLTASDVFYVSDASGTGVPSINRRPYWWLHRKRVSS